MYRPGHDYKNLLCSFAIIYPEKQIKANTAVQQRVGTARQHLRCNIIHHHLQEFLSLTEWADSRDRWNIQTTCFSVLKRQISTDAPPLMNCLHLGTTTSQADPVSLRQQLHGAEIQPDDWLHRCTALTIRGRELADLRKEELQSPVPRLWSLRARRSEEAILMRNIRLLLLKSMLSELRLLFQCLSFHQADHGKNSAGIRNNTEVHCLHVLYVWRQGAGVERPNHRYHMDTMKNPEAGQEIQTTTSFFFQTSCRRYPVDRVSERKMQSQNL